MPGTCRSSGKNTCIEIQVYNIIYNYIIYIMMALALSPKIGPHTISEVYKCALGSARTDRPRHRLFGLYSPHHSDLVTGPAVFECGEP